MESKNELILRSIEHVENKISSLIGYVIGYVSLLFFFKDNISQTNFIIMFLTAVLYFLFLLYY